MLNVIQRLFENWVMEEKDLREAREKVRAAMRDKFSLHPGNRDGDEFSRPVSASGSAIVKPYIPPTIPNDDDPYNPFGLQEAPLR